MSSAHTSLTPLADYLTSQHDKLTTHTATLTALEAKVLTLQKQLTALEQVKTHRGKLIQKLLGENERLGGLVEAQETRLGQLERAVAAQGARVEAVVAERDQGRKRDRSPAPGPDSPRTKPKLEDGLVLSTTGRGTGDG